MYNSILACIVDPLLVGQSSTLVQTELLFDGFQHHHLDDPDFSSITIILFNTLIYDDIPASIMTSPISCAYYL